jgi:hypothetical protein
VIMWHGWVRTLFFLFSSMRQLFKNNDLKLLLVTKGLWKVSYLLTSLADPLTLMCTWCAPETALWSTFPLGGTQTVQDCIYSNLQVRQTITATLAVVTGHSFFWFSCIIVEITL